MVLTERPPILGRIKGPKSVIRRETEDVIGTIEQMLTMRKCIEKGCFASPFKQNEAYIWYASTQKGLKCRLKKSGSGKDETLHKDGNKLVRDISRMADDLLGMRLVLFICKRNNSSDVLLGKRDRLTTGFSWEEMILNEMANGLLSESPYPLLAHSGKLAPITSNSELYEPYGVEYGTSVVRANEQAMVDRMMSQLQEHNQPSWRNSAQPPSSATIPPPLTPSAPPLAPPLTAPAPPTVHMVEVRQGWAPGSKQEHVANQSTHDADAPLDAAVSAALELFICI